MSTCITRRDIKTHINVVRKVTRKKPLGRPRRRWWNDIETNLGEMNYENVDWIDLNQCKLQRRIFINTVINFSAP